MSEDIPHYGPMTEQRAREILGDAIQPDGMLCHNEQYSLWPDGGDLTAVKLDGRFSADELEAIAWWMRNKTPG